MHVAEEILNRVRRLLGFGRRPMRFEVSEEEILADLSYGRDDSEVMEDVGDHGASSLRN